MSINTVVLAPMTQMRDTLRQYLNKALVVRIVYIYIAVFMGLGSDENYILVLVLLVILEAIVYGYFYIKLCKERNPRHFLYLSHVTFSSSILFVGSIFWLLIAPQSWFYFVLFVVIYLFVELKAWLIYSKMNWDKVIKLANKRKVFTVDDNDPHLFEYKVVAMSPDEQGYKKTVLDKLMDLWVLGLVFLVAPIAQLTVFTTPYRDYDMASNIIAIIFIIMSIALNKLTVATLINLKLIGMKERGEF